MSCSVLARNSRGKAVEHLSLVVLPQFGTKEENSLEFSAHAVICRFDSTREKIRSSFRRLALVLGLRGAIAFSLAMRNTESEPRQLILTTTLMIVFVTVFVNGGLTTLALQFFKIESVALGREGGSGGILRSRVGVEDDEEEQTFQAVKTVRLATLSVQFMTKRAVFRPNPTRINRRLLTFMKNILYLDSGKNLTAGFLGEFHHRARSNFISIGTYDQSLRA